MDEALTAHDETTTTAVVYLRVSSVGQIRGGDPEGYSIPGQREACRLHAERLGASVVNEYVEPGKSGTSTNRPELQKMLRDIAEIKPTYVIVYDLSRVARDDFDALWLLREIEGLGCKLESTLERVDDTPAGKLLYTVMAGVNAFRSRGDAEKVKMGLRSKHLRGETPGTAPIGYLHVRRVEGGREVRAVTVDPERAPIVATAFELYASGQHSVAALVEILANMGLRTRMTPKRSGQAMNKSMVHRMLKNDYYIGVVTWNGAKVPGTHQPIVDAETFNRVQELLRARSLSGSRSRKHEHYLKGSIYCGVCDSRMLFVEAKGTGGTYEYFRCFGRFNAGKDCHAPHVACQRVEVAVIEEYLRRPFLNEDHQARLRAEIEALVAGQVDAATHEIARAEKRLSDLKSEQQKLLQLSYKGLVDDDVLAVEQARIAKEHREVARWKSVAERDSEEIRMALDEAIRLLADAPRAYERATPEVRRLLNQAIWNRLWVVDGDIVARDVQPWVHAVAGESLEQEETSPDVSEASGAVWADPPDEEEADLCALGLTNVPASA